MVSPERKALNEGDNSHRTALPGLPGRVSDWPKEKDLLVDKRKGKISGGNPRSGDVWEGKGGGSEVLVVRTGGRPPVGEKQ